MALAVSTVGYWTTKYGRWCRNDHSVWCIRSVVKSTHVPHKFVCNLLYNLRQRCASYGTLPPGNSQLSEGHHYSRWSEKQRPIVEQLSCKRVTTKQMQRILKKRTTKKQEELYKASVNQLWQSVVGEIANNMDEHNIIAFFFCSGRSLGTKSHTSQNVINSNAIACSIFQTYYNYTLDTYAHFQIDTRANKTQTEVARVV